MKQIATLFISCALLVSSLTSCLDKYPDDAIPTNSAIKTVADADQLIIGIYSAFKSSSLYSGLLTLLPDLQCDLVYAVNGYSNIYGDIWRNELLPTNGQITAVYGQLYGVIAQCNFAIEQMDKIKPTIESDEQLDKLDQLYGEAYMARALCYSELLKLFCNAYESPAQAAKEQGVVLRTRYSVQEPIVRASLQASYDFVLSDLDRAAELLDVDEKDDSYLYALFNTTFFNEYVVYALRARIALYMRQWDEAIKYSSKVIDSDYYELAYANVKYNNTDMSYFDYMWHGDAAFEIIWKIGFTTDSYGGALGQIFANYDYLSYKPDYVPAQWVLNLYSSADLRKDAYFESTTTGYTHALTWPLLTKYFGNESFLQLNILHTSMPKVFRLAEQYLIRAEAYVNQSTPNLSKATKDIAALRSARYSSPSTPSMGTKDDAMKVIEEERVKELYMEGFRLMDLKRWGKGFKRTPQTESVSNGSSLEVKANDPRFTWPIPQHELEAPGANITPNASNK